MQSLKRHAGCSSSEKMKVKFSSASHEGVLGIRGVASLILNLGAVRKSLVRHYPCLFTEVPVSESLVVQALCMAFFSVGEWWCRLSPNIIIIIIIIFIYFNWVVTR